MPTKRGGAGDGGSPAETQEETSNRRSKRTAFGSTDQVNLKAGAVPEINRGGAGKIRNPYMRRVVADVPDVRG